MKMATEIVTPLTPETQQQAFLPFSAPWFGDEEKNEILQTLDSDWITTGPRTKAFEAKFAEYIGSGEAGGGRPLNRAPPPALAPLRGGPRGPGFSNSVALSAPSHRVLPQSAPPIFLNTLTTTP